MQFSQHFGAVIGGAYLEHCWKLEDVNPPIKLNENIKRFEEFVQSNGVALAQEVKTAAITFQKMIKGMVSMVVVAAIPQWKNVASSFNSDMYNALVDICKQFPS